MRMESVRADSTAAWSEEPEEAWVEGPEEACVGCEICGTCFVLEDEPVDVAVAEREARDRRAGASPSGWAH